MYTLDNCSYYQKKVIQNIPVYIFETHNMALPVWGSYASKYGALHLITFDSHTDTHPAFNSLLKNNMRKADLNWRKTIQYIEVKNLLKNMHYTIDDFSFEDVFRYSNKILNTEQILTGVAFGYLDSYTVCHHALENYEKDDRLHGYDATYINDRDKRIPVIREPLMLDVDLDYFRSREEMGQEFIEYFLPIFRRACAVTVAREQGWFEKEKRNNRNNDLTFSVNDAEEILIEIMSSGL